MVNKTLTLIALLLLVGGLGASQVACSGSETNAQEVTADGDRDGDGEDEPEAIPVEIAELTLGSIEETLRYSTNLEAENEVGVFAEASRKVVGLEVEEGDRVRKGQLLLRLQDDEQRTRLAKVTSQHAQAAREYERQQRLFAQELISEQAFNDATYELERLALEIDEAERQLGYTEVRAPISGTITERLVNLGDFVTMNQKLFHIIDFESIVARVFVPEKELPRVAPGLVARLTAPALAGERFAGTVLRLAPVVDPESGTVKVTVDVPLTAGLKPGMYVDVELVTAVRDDALLVPKRALVYDEDQVFVFRVGDDLEAERVLIVPQLEDKLNVQPAGGLAAGDRVVIAGQAGLKQGVEVRLVGDLEAAAAAEPAAPREAE